MEHPLIGNLEGLTTEELGSKVSELQKKLGQAQRTGNGYLTNQVRMALETYYNAYQARLADSYKKETDNLDFGNKINIE